MERGSDESRGTHRNASKVTQACVLGPPPPTGTSRCWSSRTFWVLLAPHVQDRDSVFPFVKSLEKLKLLSWLRLTAT